MLTEEVKGFKLRIAVDALCGEFGNSAFGAATNIVRQPYWRAQVKEKVRQFT